MPRRDWRPIGVLTNDDLALPLDDLATTEREYLGQQAVPGIEAWDLGEGALGTDRHPLDHKRGAHVVHLEQFYLSNLSFVRSMRLVRACAASHSSERASWCSPGTCLLPTGLSVLAPQRRQIAIRPLVSGR
jgi:hypothetical protein